MAERTAFSGRNRGRRVLIAAALSFCFLFLVMPLFLVFKEAFSQGFSLFLTALADEDARAAIRLSALVTLIVVPLNTLFGLAFAWAMTKFSFRGKSLILTLLELPFSISPVVSGMVFILLFGAGGFFYPLVSRFDVQIVFAVPGIVLATLFVTIPFVARQLIPLMEKQGREEEETALTLGAGGFSIFWHITLPNIRPALLYGVLLCTARSLGEFGAVSVVSGHIRGVTNTMPLHIEILYNEYNFQAAFAVASLLTAFALLSLVIKFLTDPKKPIAGEMS